MNRYAMFEEFNGKIALPVDSDRPTSVIVAETMMSAIQSFADKNKMNLVSFDELEGGSMRAYYQRKKLFQRSDDIIYYISTAREDA